MTKKPEFLKLVSVAILASGLLAGCASDGTSEDGANTSTIDAPATTGASAAAKNAIYSAKIKNAHAKRAGYEWRDTGALIKAAEKAAAKGDNDKAIALANKAKAQAEAAIVQAELEKARYEKIHGSSSTTSSDSGMSSDNGNDDYTVITGDNLWNISAKGSVYGNPYQWPLIYKANANQISDADLIYAGQVFTIPSASSSDVSAAVQHAKTRGAWTLGSSEASDQEYLAQ